MSYGPSLTATIAGQQYNLNDGEEIRLLSYDLGLPPIRRLAQRSPAQDGDTDIGRRIDPRYSDLFWAIHGTSLAHYRAIRARFMEVFVPREAPVQLIFQWDDGLVRAMDIYLEGTLAWEERVAVTELVSGVFKSPDPRLYDPEIHTTIFGLEGTGGGSTLGWEIPWEIPWESGAAVLDATTNLLYSEGSYLGAPEYPVIRISGPITDPIVWNETTGEKLELVGLVLDDPTEWVEIDLASPPRRDAKSITDQDGNNADNFLSTDSDLATWHLAPAGELLYDGGYSTGLNVIRVTGTNVTSQTVVVMNYFSRFYGM